ncbi:Uncharacterised protein [Sphingobacterium daejeonense]|nr:Uncharacterised protein [Sphingobacterium daejeonense]
MTKFTFEVLMLMLIEEKFICQKEKKITNS